MNVIEIIDEYFETIWTFCPDHENIIDISPPCVRLPCRFFSPCCLACEQALLCGRVKRVSRERESERRRRSRGSLRLSLKCKGASAVTSASNLSWQLETWVKVDKFWKRRTGTHCQDGGGPKELQRTLKSTLCSGFWKSLNLPDYILNDFYSGIR